MSSRTAAKYSGRYLRLSMAPFGLVLIFSLYATSLLAASEPPFTLRMNEYHIAAPQPEQNRQSWLTAVKDYRDKIRKSEYPDRSLYLNPKQTGAVKAFSCCFVFMYDRAFYNPDTNQYTLKDFLDEGQYWFGGYDSIILWQGYPQLGFDQRNQFDMYRDLPGGLPALRELISQAHERAVKVFIDYNPWDTETRREGKPDHELLAELIKEVQADGIFLDTLAGPTKVMKENIEQFVPSIILMPEWPPKIVNLSLCNASWAQRLTDLYPPGMLHLKWIEPRHMQYQISRWDCSHQTEIDSAFFNGSGMLIWENIFGAYNPWNIADRVKWRQAVGILRYFADNFTNDAWEPFYPTLRKRLYAHRWPGKKAIVFTLVNQHVNPIIDKPLIELPREENMAFYDLWNGQEIHPEAVGDKIRLIGSVDVLGCILAIQKNNVDESLKNLLTHQLKQSKQGIPHTDSRNAAKPVLEPEPIRRTKPQLSTNPPPGMVFVPKTSFHMHIEHPRRECGCYPDPTTPSSEWKRFLIPIYNPVVVHDIGPIEIKPFFIDETEVTNADFNRFLKATDYHPKHQKNFLKHWPNGKMSVELANHPVLYIDIDDARAYAKWANKRLPTEAEWQLAAQGTDGRAWPWGNEFDPNNCNTTNSTLPVKSLPAGRSPYGCYHVSGNVWELTESCRDDGHTRFVMLRGGSYFKAKGSDWYAPGGPLPVNFHAKFIRMWPGLDRCATIGFRCVVDANSND